MYFVSFRFRFVQMWKKSENTKIPYCIERTVLLIFSIRFHNSYQRNKMFKFKLNNT